MVNFPGRDRRRRVLKDELLAATANHTHTPTPEDDATSCAPRYSEAAGVEHHPQITDFVPRRYRTIATVVLAGATVTTALSALQLFVRPLAEAKSLRGAVALGVSGEGGLASWFSAVLLLVASAGCWIAYSIRRHRIDDFRGRYRVWRSATFACLLASALSVTGLHHLVAGGMTLVTGWSALREDAAWWFVLVGLPLAWIGIRTLLDVRECRLATALLVAAALGYALAAATFIGLAPPANERVAAVVVGASVLMGHWLLFAGVMSYARFVILDAQGLIPARAPATAKRNAQVAPDELEQPTRPTTPARPEPKLAYATTASRPSVPPAQTPLDDSRWVDGSRPDRRLYDDEEEDDSAGGNRRLSKADRKRLRKLKTEGRAA